MPERDFLAAVRERVVVFDGGMGATLEQFDLTAADYGGLAGKCHEALVLNRPDVIEGVHSSMLDAGAQVVETDTFQGSRLKLDEWGLGEQTLEINTRAAEIARKAAGASRFVAGSIGPTGLLPASDDPTLGNVSFAKLVEVFTEQAIGLGQIGISLSGGHALEPEQSTVAIVAHHPQAVYFGMKSGFIPTEKRGDELIAGTERGGELPSDADPDGDGTFEAEAEGRSRDPAPLSRLV